MNIQFANVTDYCAFCGTPIEKNFFNACEDCVYKAETEPEEFIRELELK